MLPLLQTTHLPCRYSQELSALMSKHVLAALAHHAEASAASRNSFHAGVSSEAEKRPVVGLQLDHAAAARHNLQQAVAGRAFRVRFERRSAIGSETQELPVSRLPAKKMSKSGLIAIGFKQGSFTERMPEVSLRWPPQQACQRLFVSSFQQA